jgi:hypothetical protein
VARRLSGALVHLQIQFFRGKITIHGTIRSLLGLGVRLLELRGVGAFGNP